ncbi:geraniol 8-hydroxylase-like [Vicia villosa]|uniref:geraniol 8-hydroxylase-like n=1 Tax=Vicia villosa TaxID=3911 RepID=UPI00273CF36C|nr:geraniol 8-hydroxylase-like [Vicia villosa]
MDNYLSQLSPEMNVAITTMLSLILIYITMNFLSIQSRKNQKYILPPGPSPFAIMSHVFELRKNPQYCLAKFSTMHGPIMHLKLGQISTVVISSADAAQEVLQTHDLLFSNRTVPQAVAVLDHDIFSLPFMPVCDLWRDLRKICKNELFSSQTLDASHALRCKKLQEILSEIDRSSLVGEAVDIGRAGFKTTMNFLSNTFFSKDFANSAGETDEYKSIIENLVSAIGTPNLVDFFPVLKMVDPQGIRGVSATYLDKLLQIIDSYIIKRLELRGGENYVKYDDMLDNLLDISQQNGQKMDNTKIKHLFLDLFVAGTDTTSYTIEKAMTELIHNPHAMLKVKEELAQIIGIGKTVQESDIVKLPYLQAIVKETLRLHPSAPLLLPRKAKIDVQIQGYTIPQGAQVLINKWAMARDPKIWNDANSFSPERFLGSEINYRGQNFQLTPFGSGRRICPGMPLAIRMLHTMLGSLINFFDWKLENGVMDIDQHLRAIPSRVNKVEHTI